MRDSKLLLLDEPTTGVDIATRDDVLHLLGEFNRDGVTVILTTHELNAVAAHLPYVVCMNRTSSRTERRTTCSRRRFSDGPTTRR